MGGETTLKEKLVRLVLIISLVGLLTLGIANFQVIISIGNINLGSLPDYTVVFFTGEPFVPVYVDGKQVGVTDASGYLVVRFEGPASYIAWAVSSSWQVSFDKVYFTVEKTPKIVRLTPTLNGKLVVFSNIYPVHVYLKDGRYVGMVTEKSNELVIPQGNYEFVFSSPGYGDIVQSFTVHGRKENPIWLEFKEQPLNVELKVVPEKFSPNGDWFEDETTIKIYSSKFASATLQIVDFSGKIVYNKGLRLHPGANEIIWNGEGVPDGRYTVLLVASDGKVEMKKEVVVELDRSRYTYRKEIAITLLILTLAVIVYLVLTSK
ncbi:hypothetical protein [Fervidobacterium thailandense]|uniref:PEGA domain-containing protein n=1 Tax=Fervidobacterium thailandense TaxID=1008305 RepID=A0A1E3G0F3_9BACT|nr:hypothetical protein [Fervidobacterium thailandense]ODN29731.1 hypothetical protein A4H02_09130 [Fervidobacterium thailandense]